MALSLPILFFSPYVKVMVLFIFYIKSSFYNLVIHLFFTYVIFIFIYILFGKFHVWTYTERSRQNVYLFQAYPKYVFMLKSISTGCSLVNHHTNDLIVMQICLIARSTLTCMTNRILNQFFVPDIFVLYSHIMVNIFKRLWKNLYQYGK